MMLAAFLRMLLPRGIGVARPYDIIASGVDALLEFRPEGKVCVKLLDCIRKLNMQQDETTLTLGVMDMTLSDTLPDGSLLTLLSRTTPQSLVC
jgi:hypothetical protein